ncbi:ACT domain-containing protein ACR10 [Senna tora]|uniref:ACT domain-containing protein ACR n=1 Tax=Senna tora TaxID=362788 RepID=A0A834SLB2_9FABA|nr:ACT domain-containing protein ACR10 [Senna tora]
MGILHEDVVMIRQAEKEGEASVITVNCPDKTGLGCDLCRIILFFGLSIVRGDVTTDGKWCYVVFWVIGKPKTRWSLLKKRLIEVCPSCSSASGISYYRSDLQPPKPPDVFLLKFCCHDRKGLLHDVTEVLCELELNIKKVKVSTTPDGKVMDLFFITDTRELLHTKKRRDDTIEQLAATLGDAIITVDIELVGPEITACSRASSFLPTAITQDVVDSQSVGNHKGLLYDIMRTLKEYNIQISYGRFSTKARGKCEMDLFIMQADGKKIVDPSKQNSLSCRLRMELIRPLRVAVVSKGPDTELLVANPVELSSKGRPLVFHDITLALKMLDTCIFLAEIRRYMIGDREWEVYRILVDEGERLCVARSKIEEGVWRMLMGWD